MGKKILISWLGNTDLKAAGQFPSRLDEIIGEGPILGALKKLVFDELHLIHEQEQCKVNAYVDWLSEYATIKVVLIKCTLRSPIDFGDIHRVVDDYLQQLTAKEPGLDISIHLSPGTPSMTAVSILLGKTKYNTRFVQSTKEKGGEFVTIPFDISAEYIPRLVKSADKKLTELSYSEAPLSAAFSDIITQNPDIKRTIQKAEKIALRDVPALIMGESGTGKEL